MLLLPNIIINGVEMPRIKYEIGGTPEYIETKMANGDYVRDITGWRRTIYAVWEWVPAETIVALLSQVRTCRYLTVEYEDIDGMQTEEFSVSIGNQRIFKFVNGDPMWANVELTATARKVTEYAGT